MYKQYELARTKGQIAKKNQLTLAQSRYTAQDDLYYDFSLLESIQFKDNDREIIEKDLMEHHAVAWFEQPLPTIVIDGRFREYLGQIKTAPHRVYRSDGKRLCVIIEVVGIEINRRERTNVWDDYEEKITYTASNYNAEKDYEVAA